MNTLKRLSIAIGASAILFGTLATSAFATVSPVTGQPSASCQAEPTAPAGFSTKGFAIAGSVYAGSPNTHSLQNANSSVAISQYDVACLQLSTH